jgi:hypothetical protein
MDIALTATNREMRHIDFYLLRGRGYEGLAVDDLNQLWTTTFKVMFRRRSAENIQAHFDFRAELDLRGMEVPIETIGAEIETLRKAQRAREHIDVFNAADRPLNAPKSSRRRAQWLPVMSTS